jgi:hypothetical protein
LKFVSKLKIDFGSEMKFGPRDFDFNEFPNSERFKPFLIRKIWNLARGFKFKSTTLNHGHF